MKVTITDIARIAGVSVATVSRVVNNKSKGVSEGTRKRIWQIVDEYNYQPSAVARGLVTGTSKIIGLIIPDITNPFYPKLAKGVEDYASEKGYHMILCDGGNDPVKELDYLKFLEEHYVTGIIYNNFKEVSQETLGRLKNSSVPTVFVDSKVDIPQSRNLYIDNRGAMASVVHYLYAQGHRSIAFIGGPEESYSSNERFKGYKDALKDLQIPFDEKLVVSGEYTTAGGSRAVQIILSRNIGFTAAAVCNDIMAVGVYDACESMGLRIPEDISVVGFDDIDIARLIRPKLTTVKQPTYEMGYKSANMLIDIIEGRQNKVGQDKVFDTDLMVRDSVKKLINYDRS